MINLLMKYLGVYGLLGVVAVAVIVPTYIIYTNYNASQVITENISQNENIKNVKEDKQLEPKSETTAVPKAESKSSSENGSKVKSQSQLKAKLDREQNSESDPVAEPNSESDTSAEPNSESDTSAEPNSAPEAVSKKDEFAKLLIDVFRVDEFGNIITAGKISEQAEIEIISDNKEILGSAETEENGNFVVFGKIQGTGLVQTVKVRGLIKHESEKKIITTDNLFFVLPKVERSNQNKKAEKIGLPTIVSDDGTDLKILRPIKSNFVESITLDTISYRDDSVAVLAGRARKNNIVRIYLDNIFVVETDVDTSGAWTVSLDSVVSGVYTLRLDEVNKTGKVQGRLELPFKRESESLVQSLGEGSITVQPGNSLWRIARKYYGRGIQYVDIFERNSHLIKDPDLIYPGQIFSLPN